jgi:hypothetical protein
MTRAFTARLLVLLAVCGLMNACAQTAGLPLWGSYGGPACHARERLQRLDEAVGSPQTVVVDFLAADSWLAMVSTAKLVTRCHPAGQGRRLVVSVPLLPRPDADKLDEVAQGRHDADFAAIARVLVDSGHRDAIVRLGWEFNGGWFPWRAKGREGPWKAAWRRAVGAMRSVDGQAFLFDWTYTLSDHDATPVELAYPGDDVVDVIGADFYHQTWFQDGPSEQLRWQRYVQAPRGLDWLSRFASAHGKWLSLPEWGTGYRTDGHGGGDSPAFVTQTLGWIARNRVLYHAYWNYPAKDYRAELSAEDLQGARAAYMEGMRAQLKKTKAAAP